MLANHAAASNDSPQGDSDYETILAALTDSARGRSFLQEFLRRNRSAETASLLTAIRRIEGLLTSRDMEPDQAANDTAIDAVIETTITTAVEPDPVVPAAEAAHPKISLASQSEAMIIARDGCDPEPMADTAPDGTFTLEIAQIEIAAAEVAEIDSFAVEIAECQVSAIEFLGPQAKDSPVDHAAPIHPAEPVHPAARAERTKTEPRDPFADFYALSSEEKIALFT